MWLLSTARAELHFFPSPEHVPGGYAILSHVWDKEEQAFQDLRALEKECALDGSNPRDKASDKIRRCCEVAETRGFHWIWNDTCCIDKTSSADLSEAINSMYQYYSLAGVCYAYLADVSDHSGPAGRLRAFRGSLWHKRGWTLQELLAPRLVVFMTREWTVLGTKFELSSILQDITGIPDVVLRHETQLADLSVATRMSFAAGRSTTRPEDRAYSLMGLFDVNIPTLYGEGGERAFRRLQEEIMRHSRDTTLFAWGSALAAYGIRAPPKLKHPSHNYHHSFLFASSPSDFDFQFLPNIRFEPYTLDEGSLVGMSVSLLRSFLAVACILNLLICQNEQRRDLVARVPTFSITPYGVRARIFIIQWRGLDLALLGWFKGKHRCGLILNPCDYTGDHQRQLFDISAEACTVLHGRTSIYRLIIFNQRAITPPISAEWRDVYLSHQPPSCSLGHLPLGDHKPWRATQFLELILDTPFCFSRERTRGLILRDALSVVTGKAPLLPWTGAEPLMLPVTFNGLYLISRPPDDYAICIGRCTNPALGHSSTNLGPHWMTVTLYDFACTGKHSCETDHIPIPEWPSIIWREYESGGNVPISIWAGVEQCSFNRERLIVTLTDDSNDALMSPIRPSVDSPVYPTHNDNTVVSRKPRLSIAQQLQAL